ncbi:hypothetical protein HaLaN_01173, partial [Haematococcus lacustris]
MAAANVSKQQQMLYLASSQMTGSFVTIATALWCASAKGAHQTTGLSSASLTAARGEAMPQGIQRACVEANRKTLKGRAASLVNTAVQAIIIVKRTAGGPADHWSCKMTSSPNLTIALVLRYRCNLIVTCELGAGDVFQYKSVSAVFFDD